MAMTAPAPPEAPGVEGKSAVAPRSRAIPGVLLALAAAVAILLAIPLCFLLVQAAQSGWGALRPVLFRQLTGQLLWNTVRLTVVVTLLCAVIGTLAAWVVERTDLPGRRLWTVLFVLPLAVPDFVESFGWVSVAPWLRGYFGAVLVMTLAVYPLVFLPVSASLRNADAAQEEVARSLGVGRLRTFWRVTVGQARLAILGGSLLVALVLLAEYGAFEILGYRTFTTEIYTEYLNGFDPPAASALSLVLVLLSLFLLFGEGASRGEGRVARTASLTARPPFRHRLGRATPGTLAGAFALVALALGVPVGAIVYWLFHGQGVAVASSSVASAAWHTIAYSASAGLLATVLALPVALLAVRHPGRPARLLERSTYLVLGIPGILIALGLVVLLPALLLRPALPEQPVARRGVLDHVLPAGTRRRAHLARAVPAALGGGGPFARHHTPVGVHPGDAAAHRPRPGRGVQPGVLGGGDGAHRHPRAPPDGCRDAGHAVLVVPDEPLLRPGRALRGAHHRHRRSAERRARALVRPVAGPPGRAGGPAPVMTDLRVSDLHKSYGDVVALRGVDLVVPTGSFTAVLGPSGSGKTTLLRVIAGFERADRGSVTLGGVVVEDDHHHEPPEGRRVGYVPQEGALFPHLSVEKNVGFGIRGRADRRRRVDELLDMVGLSGLGPRYPHQLSGGQQQRVALARALAVRPQMILLDEPFAALDARLRASVRAEVLDVLHRAGTTSVFVTHDQDEALSMADQVAVLGDGRVRQVGTPRELYAHPVDPGVARFLGSANLIAGTFAGRSVHTALGELGLDRSVVPRDVPRRGCAGRGAGAPRAARAHGPGRRRTGRARGAFGVLRARRDRDRGAGAAESPSSARRPWSSASRGATTGHAARGPACACEARCCRGDRAASRPRVRAPLTPAGRDKSPRCSYPRVARVQYSLRGGVWRRRNRGPARGGWARP